VFGGGSSNGSISREVFCCEMNPDKIFQAKAEYKLVIQDVKTVIKK
jgi:hypothetical protein